MTTEDFPEGRRNTATSNQGHGIGFAAARRGHWNWRDIALELAIVFVGLFAALQLDTYNDQRNFREAQHRYLERLQQELVEYRETASDQLRFTLEFHRSVAHVSDSFVAGEIIDGDTYKFERGLIYVGHLPSNPLPRTSYNEMVAAGMFTALESEALKRAISDLYSVHDFTEENFTWWREGALALEAYLYDFVEYYDDDGPPLNEGVAKNEPERRVRFNFDELAANRRIRNGFYWAKDIHSDWAEWSRDLLDFATNADNLILQELK
jgi:hypothetical protein